MYTFPDRNDESLALRPEGTAGCVVSSDRKWFAQCSTKALVLRANVSL